MPTIATPENFTYIRPLGYIENMIGNGDENSIPSNAYLLADGSGYLLGDGSFLLLAS